MKKSVLYNNKDSKKVCPPRSHFDANVLLTEIHRKTHGCLMDFSFNLTRAQALKKTTRNAGNNFHLFSRVFCAFVFANERVPFGFSLHSFHSLFSLYFFSCIFIFSVWPFVVAIVAIYRYMLGKKTFHQRERQRKRVALRSFTLAINKLQTE